MLRFAGQREHDIVHQRRTFLQLLGRLRVEDVLRSQHEVRDRMLLQQGTIVLVGKPYVFDARGYVDDVAFDEGALHLRDVFYPYASALALALREIRTSGQ